MTLSLSRITRLWSLSVAAMLTATTFAAVLTPAPAAANDHKIFYKAELSQPASEKRAIAGGVAWSCKGTMCVAAKGNSRPIRVCRELQREVGEIASFTTKGKVLADDKLARCNG